MTSTSSPLISVCIPAYQRTHYLQRLLRSIAEQTFQRFEVIISDDSKDDSVQQLTKKYEGQFSLLYYRNQPSLGTPANWNFAISKASGEWIKIMHDDDWFASSRSLQTFADATQKEKHFIVSGYNNIDDSGTILYRPSLKIKRRKALIRNPMLLLSENYIGQPSVIMVHRSVKAKYDERMKWRVDIDYYIQLLETEREFTFVSEELINLGIGNTQVTHSCLNVPGVELPEGWMLIEKYGISSLKDIRVYDAWWRIIRNTGTRGKAMLYKYADSWPKVIENMAEHQNKLSSSLLKKGVYSKLMMMVSYLREFIA